jgi:hypothetical protein
MNRNHKYGAVKTCYNGIRYDSKAESRWARWLDMLKLAALPKERVVNIERQVVYQLAGGIRCKLDFRVTYADKHMEVHEVKGFETPEWKLKLKLFREAHPDVVLRVVKLTDGKFKSTIQQ